MPIEFLMASDHMIVQRKVFFDEISSRLSQFGFIKMALNYSIVKGSSADLGFNFKIVQNRPKIKAVCTQISNLVLHIWQYFDISEKK